jgi:acetylornithine/succinyldiaminopimelate/putrescine aminotransferase
MGEIFRGRMKALNSKIIKNVRGKGLLNAVIFEFPNGKTDQDFTQRATTELRRRESATHLSVTSLKCYLSPTEHFQN